MQDIKVNIFEGSEQVHSVTYNAGIELQYVIDDVAESYPNATRITVELPGKQ